MFILSILARWSGVLMLTATLLSCGAHPRTATIHTATIRTATILAQEAKVARPPRHIIICVDGVGFSLIEKMRTEGRFRFFDKPARMIAPFPTLTNVAMTDILQPAGAGESPGYEDNYFDVTSNRLQGGLLDRFRGDRFIQGSFRELFDYHPSAVKSGLGYAAPPISTYLEALSDLVRLRQKARAARGPVFFAYTGASDSLAHLGGQRLLRSFLTRLDNMVADIQREDGGRTRITIFSDHGNHFRKYERVSLKAALQAAEFRLEGSVRDDRSVVLPQFGLIGCAVLFTTEANEAKLAQAAATAHGVDFAAYEKSGVVQLVASNGTATIEKRGSSFRYRTIGGDPLELNSVLSALTAEGKVDPDGFVADADWFKATRDAAQPDAVRRVYDGTINHVRNRASVVLNFRDGYYTGSSTLDIFAFLQATHGNLGREQSEGFVMSTEPGLPAVLRAEEVWEAIGSPSPSKSVLAHH